MTIQEQVVHNLLASSSPLYEAVEELQNLQRELVTIATGNGYNLPLTLRVARQKADRAVTRCKELVDVLAELHTAATAPTQTGEG